MEQQPTNLNIQKLIQFRQDMHSLPELGFKEFKTQQNIKKYLLELGISEQQIKICGKTGYIVDIYGKGPVAPTKRLIGLRADIDGLPMWEQNQHLTYKSQNDNMHACGHDGHTATLLGTTTLVLQNLEKIPSNRGIRLVFQPSEEGPTSGAVAMIKDGCLQDLDEIYGYHNFPSHPVGYIIVQPGCQLGGADVFKLKLIGKGGHGSQPQNCIDPTQMGVDFHIKFRDLKNGLFKNENFISTIPHFQSGETYNVIATEGIIQGTLRYIDRGFNEKFQKEFRRIVEELKSDYPGSDYELDYQVWYPPTINTESETNHVIKLGKEIFGSDKVVKEFYDDNMKVIDQLPSKASEDFSYFLNEIPGCYFFMGSGRKVNDTFLHNNQYNFNDDLIEPAANYFLELVLNRLQN